ncbi:hypothetical protein [Bradyrhizobium sp. 157]|nr:hypothetical protein [Bradyrhizobium sp. 157]
MNKLAAIQMLRATAAVLVVLLDAIVPSTMTCIPVIAQGSL